MLKQGSVKDATAELEQLSAAQTRTATSGKAASGAADKTGASLKGVKNEARDLHDVLNVLASGALLTGSDKLAQFAFAGSNAATALKEISGSAKLLGSGALLAAIAAAGVGIYALYEKLKMFKAQMDEVATGDAAMAMEGKLALTFGKTVAELRAYIEELLRLKLIQREVAESALAKIPGQENFLTPADRNKSIDAITGIYRDLDPQHFKGATLKDSIIRENDARAVQAALETQKFGVAKANAMDFGPTAIRAGGVGGFGSSNELMGLYPKLKSEALDYFNAVQDLVAKGLLKQVEADELTLAHDRESWLARINLAHQGYDAVKETQLGELTENQRTQAGIAKIYDERRALVKAYYDFEIEQAQDAGRSTIAIEQDKANTLKQLNQQSKEATFAASDAGKVLNFAAERFADGASTAIVGVISGTKKAKEAFKEMAASFLQEVAKMILQQQILNLVRAIGKGIGGLFGFADGGQVAAMAHGGMIAAANGVSGVSTVSSPTYFPKFNVLAGEAGSEVMTVLARPRMMQVGGIQAQVGQAGSHTLAITNANDLAKAAGGGERTHIVVELSQGLEARIVEQASNVSVAKVTNQVQRATPLREAVASVNR